ncbi:hypothetical protein ABW19_dt0208775 [Dactylella cylindrospora]|nr:hypothetical protein ABW19_dt0208775 [Dactylella cylindrospora]
MADISVFTSELQPQLSSGAKIVGSEGTITRWDEASTPVPKVTVFPATEQDVAATVKFCKEKGLKCLAQSGGHSFNIKNQDSVSVIISMRGLNSVTVAEDCKSVAVGGGAVVSEFIKGAHAKGLEVPTGVCNTVGVFGSLLNGGVGRYMGKYGLGIDNLLSVNFVDANGKLHQNVTEETDADLWWALRGAGTSIGIVTEGTVKAYPQSVPLTWSANLIYTDYSKIEKIVETLGSIELSEDMAAHMVFAAPPPMGLPVIMLVIWYCGTEDDGRVAWKPLLDLGPAIVEDGMLTADHLNDGNDPFGETGGRKPGFGLGIQTLNPAAYRKVWDSYVNFLKDYPEAGRSVFLCECYPRAKTLSVPREATAFANRDSKFEVLCVPWYESPDFDAKATAWTNEIRTIWLESCGHADGRTRSYPAFSGRRESLEALYGEKERLDKLKAIKKKWDPENYWDALLSA